MNTLALLLITFLVISAQQQSYNSLENCQLANLISFVCVQCKSGFTLTNNRCVSSNTGYSTSGQTSYGSTTTNYGQTNQGQSSTQSTSTQTQNSVFVPLNIQGSGQSSTSGSSNTQNSATSGSSGVNTQWNSANNNYNFQNSQSSTGTSGSVNSGWSVSNQVTSSYSDGNCKVIDHVLGICSECYPSFYYGPQDRKCIPVNPLCKTYTKTNICLSCYKGYKIQGITCVIDNSFNTPGIGDVNCKVTNNGICSQCYKGFYFNLTQNICVVANPLCKTYTNDNRCTSCYPGYNFYQNQGICVHEPNVQGPSQSGVVQTGNSAQGGQQQGQNQGSTSNIYSNIFTSGSSGSSGSSSGAGSSSTNNYVLPNGNTLMMFGAYYIEFNLQGQIVNIYPANFFSTQQQSTVSNNLGSQVQSNQSSSSSQSSQSTQSSPSSTSQTGQVQCYHRQIVKNNQCVNVSDQCQTWNTTTGACTSCYSGYSVVGEACVVTSKL